jgi:hypothetical protein
MTVSHSVKGYVSYNIGNTLDSIVIVASDLNRYLPSVDQYHLSLVPVVFTVYLVLISLVKWLLSSIPVVNIILYPIIILLEIFDIKIYALLVAIVYTTFDGFCKGYYYRENLIKNETKIFLPNIRMEIYWQQNLIYKTNGAYFLPHKYTQVPKWVFNTYGIINSMSNKLKHTHSKNVIKRMLQNLHKKLV